MSGGNMGYAYIKIEEVIDEVNDTMIKALLEDLKIVIHDMEWCRSADIGEEDYRKSYRAFFKKWVNENSNGYKECFNQKIAELREEINNIEEQVNGR